MEKKILFDFVHNPLIHGKGMIASIGSVEDYEMEQKLRNEAIKADPRYPQWLQEAKDLREAEKFTRKKEEEETEETYNELFATFQKPNLIDRSKLKLFIFEYNDGYSRTNWGIIADSLAVAQSILFKRLVKQKESKSFIVSACKSTIVKSIKTGLAFEYKWED